ncbi:glycosyltransferase family A protein [Roseimicrobium sp. ORNL1]|uniref:glycosyltransferase family 2 protein n=1 Tax=Roseimicrobium sp. ORNL1 TaxID=2711231 RepID=UPI0013E1044F|nr:glycosyltransferase family A protein [Roseimicrobium sp. ORNL1]QIF02928.1 glycosyltransferase family 2 protein [Roseimicrobium sp. ORNL1]
MNSNIKNLVSVLVPTYNAGPYLKELVESVKRQDYEEWELLILDDGSGDLKFPGTEECLNDPRIRTFTWGKNRGVSQATLFLMQQARGEFWCYPGADDVLKPAFLSARLGVMNSYPDVALVFGKGGQIDSEGKQVWFDLGMQTFEEMRPLENQLIEPEQMLQILLGGNIISTPSILGRTTATLPILTRYQMDWRYCQDWFYWLLLASGGIRFYYHGEMLHDYRVHQHSLSQSNESWAWRNVEPSLVLLTALHLSAGESSLALSFYERCRHELYANWLVRSARFRKHPSWKRWSSLANLTKIQLLEWPWVFWNVLRVYIKRRRARSQAKVMHGLPSFYSSWTES